MTEPGKSLEPQNIAEVRRRLGFVALLWWIAAVAGTIGLVQGLPAGWVRLLFVGLSWVLACFSAMRGGKFAKGIAGMNFTRKSRLDGSGPRALFSDVRSPQPLVRRAFLCWLIILVAVLLPTLAPGWGDVGHTTINRVAAEKIPSDMPTFLKAASNRIAWLGPEPDRWRSELEKPLNDAQAPDHFIDLEYVDWLKPLPPDRYAFIQAVYEYRAQHPDAGVPPPEKIGFQPYITIEVFDRLKVAFREYRHAQAEGARRPTRRPMRFFTQAGSATTSATAPTRCTPRSNTTAGWGRIPRATPPRMTFIRRWRRRL